MITETDIQNIKTALQCWDADDYDDWVHVCAALKADGYPFYLFDEWSKTGRSYKGVTETQYKWDSFRNNDGDRAITTKSIFKRAIDEGVKFVHNPDPKKRNPKETDIAYPRDFVMGLTYTDGHLHIPAYAQLMRYLQVLYKPEDIIGVTTKKHTHLEGGKWKPAAGESVKVSNVISTLKSTMDIEKAVGDINPKAGAWIYLNTYDGKGFGNNNCVTFKYTLIECDELEPEKQEQMYIAERLPVVALVTSGARSIHAIVRIDAKDIDEYSRRVRYMHDVLQKRGLPIDMGVGNPARMSRMPGVKRDGVEQSLLLIEGMDKLRTCCHDYLEWERYTKGEKPKETEQPKRDPLVITYPMEITTEPKLKPAIIEGLLRRGAKMEVSGASKSSKSFFLSELAVDLSEGKDFLGLSCAPSKTLYINLENTREECDDRFYRIRRALEMEKRENKMLGAITLTGKNYSLSELVQQLIDELDGEEYDAIIVDPLYKVMEGDENKAADMTKILNQFDKLRIETGAAVIYAHHHSKGAQGGKDAQDRASGSGVTARDFDALIDKVKLEVPNEVLKSFGYGDRAKAYRLDFVARSFAEPEPMDVVFDYPLHVVPDDEDVIRTLKKYAAKGSDKYEAQRAAGITAAKKGEAKAERFDEIEKQLDEIFSRGIVMIMSLDAARMIAELPGVTHMEERSRRNALAEHCKLAASKYQYVKGCISKKNENF